MINLPSHIKNKLFDLLTLFGNSHGLWIRYDKPEDLTDEELLEELLGTESGKDEDGRRVTGFLEDFMNKPGHTGKVLQGYLDFVKQK